MFPVVITEADDLKSLEFGIVENVQRHDLNPSRRGPRL
jgi:ParB family chromosome partitioning protein